MCRLYIDLATHLDVSVQCKSACVCLINQSIHLSSGCPFNGEAVNPLIYSSLATVTKDGQRWLSGNGAQGPSIPPWIGYQGQPIS